MAKKKSSISERMLPIELKISQEDAGKRLQAQVDKGLKLKNEHISTIEELKSSTNEYDTWDSFNALLLKQIFTTDELSNEYSLSTGVYAIFDEPTLSNKIAFLYDDISERIHRIDSIIKRLELIPLSAENQHTNTSKPSTKSSNVNNKVFVVHGHDEIAKNELELFLREIGINPIVLHREVDEGQTLIEKFEKHSDVGYTFIILTPDEIACSLQDDLKDDRDLYKELRARPNVIFEFGYFIGKLGRSRVCCLYTGCVSLPSDLHGFIYKKYDNKIDEIKYEIIKELQAAGYNVTV